MPSPDSKSAHEISRTKSRHTASNTLQVFLHINNKPHQTTNEYLQITGHLDYYITYREREGERGNISSAVVAGEEVRRGGYIWRFMRGAASGEYRQGRLATHTLTTNSLRGSGKGGREIWGDGR